MAQVTKELIVALREKTNVGMMDCKKALIEADGNVEEAVTLLRKKGIAVAAKRGDNATDEGIVDGISNGKSAAIAQIACETDFSARTADMKSFLRHVVSTSVNYDGVDDTSSLMEKMVTSTGLSLKHMLDELISKISEKIHISKSVSYKTDEHGIVNIYVHPDHSVAAMVELRLDRSANESEKVLLMALAKDVCMQIAVTSPLALTSDDLEQGVIDKELDTIKALLAQSGKPESMLDKIAVGKIGKFYEDVCLLNQKFIKDNSKTIEKHLDALGTEMGLKITLSRFSRFGVGR
jgi:elongation factor Ts